MTEQPITTILRAAARSTDRILAERLAPLGLTAPRLELLAAYADNPGGSSASAARAVGITAQSAAVITGTLTSRGLITITPPQPGDGRAQPINVTDAGHSLLADAHRDARPVEKRITALLGASGIRRLREAATALAEDAAADTKAPEPVEDPRFTEVGHAAMGLHWRALMWADAAKTDTLPGRIGRRFNPSLALVHRLENAGLWKPDGDGWRVR